jgi:hypothetical protein
MLSNAPPPQKKNSISNDLKVQAKKYSNVLSKAFRFQKKKFPFRERKFVDIVEIKAVLDSIIKLEFQRCFQWWEIRWAHCVFSQGDF